MRLNKNSKKLRTRSAQDLSLQMEGLLLLKEILNKTFDKWFLSGGTLLGAFRDGDFIPWDWDVEVSVLAEEAVQKEGELLKNLIAAGFLISSNDTSIENFKISVKGWGTEFEILGRCLNDNKDLRTRNTTKIPAYFFEKIEMITFRGHNFPAPSPINNYLEALYGDWKTPLKTANKKKYFSKVAYQKNTNRFLNRVFKKTLKILYPEQIKEFPVITENEIRQFSSWDQELGWCNQPNKIKVDKIDYSRKSDSNKTHLSVFTTDDKGSRICSYPKDISDISLYGDSYSMCRDVNDKETISWYLGELRKTRVSNYGVSNYGLDQSLLRLKRNYNNDPSKIIILGLNSYSMAYSCSIYGNYLDSGNILAIKPCFQTINKDRELKLIRYPFKNKRELLSLSNYKNFFQSHDKHYNFWRKKKIKYYIEKLPKKILKKFNLNFSENDNQLSEYKLSFWHSEENLFLNLMAFYQKLSDDFNFIPVIMLQHSKQTLKYQKGKLNADLEWTDPLIKAKKKFPKIKFIDEIEIFKNYDDINELYSYSHHSPKANNLIANFVNNSL